MPSSPHIYLVGLGTNLGDRAAYIAAAVKTLGVELGTVVAQSPLYETEPVGAADRRFLNAALVAASELPPAAAMAVLLAAEAAMGRVRTVRWGNRVIDLDLLLWKAASDLPTAKTRSVSEPGLTLPHPRLLERDFALVPACVVAGSWVHPETGKTLAAECAERGYRLEVWTDETQAKS